MIQLKGGGDHRNYFMISLHERMGTFADSLDPYQAQQNVGPDLDPICLTLTVFLKEFFKKVAFKKSADNKKA